nr:ras guanine nucleotide exchange factor K-like [Halisarca dujardinii]
MRKKLVSGDWFRQPVTYIGPKEVSSSPLLFEHNGGEGGDFALGPPPTVASRSSGHRVDRRPSGVSCSDDSGSESMIDMLGVVGVHVDSLREAGGDAIYIDSHFGSELTIDASSSQQQVQIEEFRDKEVKRKLTGKVHKRKESVKVRKTKTSSSAENGDSAPQKGPRLSRDSGLDEQTVPPVTPDKAKSVSNLVTSSFTPEQSKRKGFSEHSAEFGQPTAMLSQLCTVTVSLPADFSSSHSGRGSTLQFRFNPFTLIEYLRISILKQFHERFSVAVDHLSKLHLCHYLENEEGWEWLEEDVSLQSYALPRECKLDLKPCEAVYHDVRVVVPHIGCTLYVEYDQFSTCGDIVRQILDAAEPDPSARHGYNLFHVRLRHTLENGDSLMNYHVVPNDILECRVALGRLQAVVLMVRIPAINSIRKMKVSLDETIGELISTLKRRIPNPDSPRWRHMQLFLIRSKPEPLSIWLDDYKFLATYRLTEADILEFKPKYRPMTFELPGGVSTSGIANSNPEVLIGENTTVDSIVNLICNTCSLEYDPSYYGLFLHDEEMIKRPAKLWEYLDCKFSTGYQDTLVVHLEHRVVKVQLIGEESVVELKVDFSVPCRVLRDTMSRRRGLRNPSFYGLTYQGFDLNLELSLHNQGVLEGTQLLMVRHSQRVSDPLPHEPPISTVGEPTTPTPSTSHAPRPSSYLVEDSHIWLEKEDCSDNIVFDKIRSSKEKSILIAAATFNKLVERLTSSSEHDMQFVKTFLLTYQSFTSPERLLRKLIERYNVVRAPNMDSLSFNMFRTTIQVRVINAIKLWLETGVEFRDSVSLQDKVMSFVQTTVKQDHPIHCRTLRTNILIIKGVAKKKQGKAFSRPAPPVKYPRKTGTLLSLFDFDPEEIARQMTVIDFSLFTKIRPTELMNQNWSKPKRKHIAQNFLRLVERMNNLTLWTATTILSQRDVNDRAKRMVHFAQVANHLHEMNNFSSLMAILDGFIMTPIDRLKKTLTKCDRSSMKRVNELQKIMDPSHGFKSLRAVLADSTGPCIPYMGLFTSDLTHLDDGNDTFTPDNLINCTKCRLIYNRIRDFMLFQDRPYNFEQIPALHNSLTKFHFLDKETLYDVSLKVEPRNSGR